MADTNLECARRSQELVDRTEGESQAIVGKTGIKRDGEKLQLFANFNQQP